MICFLKLGGGLSFGGIVLGFLLVSDLEYVVSRTGSPLPGSLGPADCLCFTLLSLAERPPPPGNSGRQFPAVTLGEKNFFKGPFHEGKKTVQKPHLSINLTIQGPLTDFYTGLQGGGGDKGGGKQTQKREERNSLDLVRDVNKKIVQIAVDGGGWENREIFESSIDYTIHFYLDIFPT